MMASPPAHIIAEGKREAIEAVRKVTTHSRAHMVRDHNSAGLPRGKEGRSIELRVVSLQGEEGRDRHIRCNTFCTYLANQPELVQAFKASPMYTNYLPYCYMSQRRMNSTLPRDGSSERQDSSDMPPGRPLLVEKGPRTACKGNPGYGIWNHSFRKGNNTGQSRE